MIIFATDIHGKVDIGNQFRTEDPKFMYLELKMMRWIA